ncbi:MAG: histidine phosphatase family protein [Actinomycetota bacterium]
MRKRGVPAAAVSALLLFLPAAAAGNEALWALLKGGGQVVVMRHASTDPGVGDPPGFRLEDCATQRNLSPKGREEARRVGAAFRARGIPVGRVLSSRWCRCLETARLAFGAAEPWPPLNSFFDDRRREPEQTRSVRALAGERPGTGNVVLVTHQVNISALTGVFPAPGEIVVLTPQGSGMFRVAGRLAPAALPPN